MHYVFIVTNSPGELIGWVRPVVRSLKKKASGTKIVVVITPCQYASGMEREVAKGFPAVDFIVGPSEYLKYVFLGIRPSQFGSADWGVILFLGGDPFHALLLSRRLGFPAVAYTQKLRWKRHFEKFMVLNERIKEKFIARGVKPEKIVVVGDPVIDGVHLERSREEVCNLWELSQKEFIISMLPGSTSQEVKYMAPFFLKVAELIREEFAHAQFLFLLSPFTSRDELMNISQRELNKAFEGVIARQKKEDGHWKLVTETGLEALVIEDARYEAMNISDLAITLPGTSTAEMAFLGIPMVVSLPLNKPQAIPLDGLAGLIGEIPWLGVLIKKWVVRSRSKHIRFTALPNIEVDREIVPEVRGVIEASLVAEKAKKLLKNLTLRINISRQLKEIAGEKGAAEKIADIVLNSGLKKNNQVKELLE